ncbi:MAG: O-antigen ligase family protein, partial [Solirubrobacteraceae bacterium]
SARTTIARVLTVSAVILAPFIVVEAATGFNPFVKYFNHGGGAAVWALPVSLAGANRADASWGHPIALSMFLAVALMLGGALAVEAGSRQARHLWALSCIVILLCEFLTISRTAWLTLGVGLVVAMFLIGSPRVRRRFVYGLIAAAIGLTLVGRFGPESVSVGIPIVGRGNAKTTESTEYRQDLLKVALDDGVLRPFGTRVSTLANRVIANYSSLDNEYLDLADKFGYIPAIVLLCMVPALALCATGRKPTDYLAIMYLASAFGLMVAVATVAFITQQQVLVWLMLGICSGIAATSPRRILIPRRDRFNGRPARLDPVA